MIGKKDHVLAEEIHYEISINFGLCKIECKTYQKNHLEVQLL